MDILSARLVASEKFIMLEREDLDLINSELEMNNLGSINIAADYLILGSISGFGRNTTGEVGVFSRTKKQTAFAKVNIRLVDVSTGQMIYSEEGSGEAFSEVGTVLGAGSRAGYDSSLNDKVISVAISKLVNNIIENLTEKPWRSYILNIQNDNIVIAGGKTQGINIGDTFNVFKKGNISGCAPLWLVLAMMVVISQGSVTLAKDSVRTSKATGTFLGGEQAISYIASRMNQNDVVTTSNYTSANVRYYLDRGRLSAKLTWSVKEMVGSQRIFIIVNTLYGETAPELVEYSTLRQAGFDEPALFAIFPHTKVLMMTKTSP